MTIPITTDTAIKYDGQFKRIVREIYGPEHPYKIIEYHCIPNIPRGERDPRVTIYFHTWYKATTGEIREWPVGSKSASMADYSRMPENRGW